MNFGRKTALIMAVFLSLVLNGCYTKFAHRGLLESQAQAVTAEADSDRWEFGYGWYRSMYQSYDVYHGYYYGQWWDDCAWLQEPGPEGRSGIIDDQSGKIGRRDNHSFQPGVIITPPVIAPDTLTKAPPVSGGSEPIIRDNNAGGGGANDQNSGAAKLGRRGRR